MQNDKELLRRRSAAYHRLNAKGGNFVIERYLKMVQDETASSADVMTEVSDDLGPAFLRSRATHYRALADRERSEIRAKLFREVAAVFEQRARIKERGPSSVEIQHKPNV